MSRIVRDNAESVIKNQTDSHTKCSVKNHKVIPCRSRILRFSYYRNRVSINESFNRVFYFSPINFNFCVSLACGNPLSSLTSSKIVRTLSPVEHDLDRSVFLRGSHIPEVIIHERKCSRNRHNFCRKQQLTLTFLEKQVDLLVYLLCLCRISVEKY